ncbi:hypothetical protein BDR04DRAFT_517982 [Suillus decipiens]|nr:hypothetical protein BDR04DRAFT_517982 [Suillus decipiens]
MGFSIALIFGLFHCGLRFSDFVLLPRKLNGVRTMCDQLPKIRPLKTTIVQSMYFVEGTKEVFTNLLQVKMMFEVYTLYCTSHFFSKKNH